MKNVLLIIIVLLVSCSPSGELKKGKSGEAENLLENYESEFDPSEFVEDLTKNNKKGEEIEIKPKGKVESEIVNGFRIQILMTKEISEANSTKSQLTEMFPELGIHIIFESPYYKIRIGDFLDRETATRFLPNVIERGYKNAWIVPDKIIKIK